MSAGNGQHNGLNFAVSLGAATHNRTSDTDFLSVVADIASDKWRAEIEHIRAIYSKVEAGARADGLAEEEVVDLAKDAIDELKKQLPAVLWSGTFAKRSAGALKEHNGLVHVDLDQLGSDREVWRNLIKQDRHTLFCTTSPSGQGLKVVYRCDPARPHLESFRAAEHHVLQQFGLTADPACKDVSRLCFVTWDPDAYLNLDAVPLPYPAAAPVEYKHAAPSTAFTGLKPGDDYDARGPWPSVLIEAGWTSHGDNHRWTRPNKTHGISATWDQHPIHPKRFYVFSSNAAPFEAEHLYKPWHIYALLKCGGDLAKAAKELYAQNYGDRVEVTKPRVEDIEFEEGGRNGDAEPAAKPRDYTVIRAEMAKCLFDPKKKLPKPRTIYSLGGTQISTPGNMTAVYSHVKTGKSSLIGAMLAATMTTPSNNHDTLGIEGPNYGKLAVLHFDTEQSPYDWQQILYIALRRVGLTEPPPWLLSYSLTGKPAHECRLIVEVAMLDAKARFGGIHSVLIDGVAELVVDPNEPKECFPVVTKLHAMAIEYETAIVNILHMNPNSENKGRGHLGSQLERKSESNLILEKVGDITCVYATKQRGKMITKDKAPSFSWSENDQMHRSCGTPEEMKETKKGRPEVNTFAIYRSAIPKKDEQPLPLTQLAQRCSVNKPIKPNNLFNALERWIKEGAIEVVETPQGRKYRQAV